MNYEHVPENVPIKTKVTCEKLSLDNKTLRNFRCITAIVDSIHSWMLTFWLLSFAQADLVILVNAGFCFESKTGLSKEEAALYRMPSFQLAKK